MATGVVVMSLNPNAEATAAFAVVTTVESVGGVVEVALPVTRRATNSVRGVTLTDIAELPE